MVEAESIGSAQIHSTTATTVTSTSANQTTTSTTMATTSARFEKLLLTPKGSGERVAAVFQRLADAAGRRMLLVQDDQDGVGHRNPGTESTRTM